MSLLKVKGYVHINPVLYLLLLPNVHFQITYDKSLVLNISTHIEHIYIAANLTFEMSDKYIYI